MTKATIFDAVASSFLEVKCDEYENEQLIGKKNVSFLSWLWSCPY